MYIGGLAVISSTIVHKDATITLDPSHAFECGLEKQSSKEDTTQLTIAVLTVEEPEAFRPK